MTSREDRSSGAAGRVVIIDRSFRILFDTEKEMNRGGGQALNEIYPEILQGKGAAAEAMDSDAVRRQDGERTAKGSGERTAYTAVPVACCGRTAGAALIFEQASKRKDAQEKGDTEVTFDQILTQSQSVFSAVKKARFMARLPNPTLIYGETGTGKELFAQAMITESGADRRKTVVQNCAAIPENLFESILFGTQRGVYTGAENKRGLFEEADGGVLFLDELNAMPYSVQGKLLRVLQNGTFRKLGSADEQRVSVKVIAAMNIDPVEAMEKKIIRTDLFYRFSSGMIYIPPLRERREDIDFYLDHFRLKMNKRYGKKIRGFSPPLKNFLENYPWDGNVRELIHMLESMIAMSDGQELTVEDLPRYVREKAAKRAESGRTQEEGELLSAVCKESAGLRQAMEAIERVLIQRALMKTGGNHSRASRLLGIPRATLNYKMKKLDLEE